jgi:hypothetical protein
VSLRDLEAVPPLVWIWLLLLTGGVIVLAVGLYKLRGQHRALLGSVATIDDDLATAEEGLEKQRSALGQAMIQVRDLKDVCAQLNRPPVKPNVPSTDPLMRRQSAFPVFPYNPKRDPN